VNTPYRNYPGRQDEKLGSPGSASPAFHAQVFKRLQRSTDGQDDVSGVADGMCRGRDEQRGRAGVLKREGSDSPDASRRQSPTQSFRFHADTKKAPKVTSKQAQAVFDTQVKDFCLETGGNKGTMFGIDGCFAVGVQQEDLVHDMRSGVKKVGLFVPKGFSEGREVKTPACPSKSMTFEEFLKPPSSTHAAFGRISWDSAAEPSNYIRVPSSLLAGQQDPQCLLRSQGKSMCMHDPVAQDQNELSGARWPLPHLLAFFAERVWNLKPPKLVISVVGSSTDFEMNVLDRNAIFHTVMNVAKETEAWITTIGLDAGIAKYMGEAKVATNAKVPLIGITPWGLVEGRYACTHVNMNQRRRACAHSDMCIQAF